MECSKMEKLKLRFKISPRWIVIFGLIVNWHGNSARAYTLNQQERLLNEMISDLRDAYNAQLNTFNKRITELENTIGILLGGKLNRASRLLHPSTETTPAPQPRVAFYAQLSHDMTGVGDFQAIVFDSVTTNVAKGYNQATGIFTAPYTGTYVFSWTAYNVDHTHMQTELVVNNEVKGRTWSDAGNHEDVAIASNTVVVTLTTGDAVWIRSNTVHWDTINGALMTTFSGWLLFTD